MKNSISRKVFDIFNILFLLFLCAAVFVPFIKILSDSLANHSVYGLNLFGDVPDIIAYKNFASPVVQRRLWVSVITTLGVTFFGVLISGIAAYILIQNDMPGVKIFRLLLIIALLFDAGLIPKFLVIKKLGLYNSLWAIILPMSVNVVNIFLLRSYFEELPKSISEAAEIDGCTPLQTFFLIVMPLSRGPLAVIGLLFATAAWNEYIGFIMYISESRKYNLQFDLRDLIDRKVTVGGTAVNLKTFHCAQIIYTIIPTLVLMPLFMHFFGDDIMKLGGRV